MDLLDALAATDTDRGPRSNLAIYLDYLVHMDLKVEAQVVAELKGKRQPAHLARALTLMARKSGAIGESATISGASITKWRDANGS